MLLETVHIRKLKKEDYPACAKIYKEGMATGMATFETQLPTWEQWDAKFIKHCRLVAESKDTLLGWSALTPFSSREVYQGVAEVSLYIAANARGKGTGKQLLQACIENSEAEGFWTLQAKIFSQNTASLRLFEKLGFRQVGIRIKLGQRDGIWHDNVLVERRTDLF